MEEYPSRWFSSCSALYKPTRGTEEILLFPKENEGKWAEPFLSLLPLRALVPLLRMMVEEPAFPDRAVPIVRLNCSSSDQEASCRSHGSDMALER